MLARRFCKTAVAGEGSADRRCRAACHSDCRGRVTRPTPHRAAMATKKDDAFQTSIPAAILIDAESDSLSVREERRPAGGAGQPRQADDARSRVQRDQAGPAQARRRVHRSARTPGARAARRRTARPCSRRSTAGSRSTTCCTASSSSPATTPASRSPKGIAGNETAFGAHDDQARARDRPDQIDLHQCRPACPIPNQRVTARELAQLARHIMQDLSGFLPLFRRARIHLEQDPPAEPQSAARPWVSAPTA